MRKPAAAGAEVENRARLRTGCEHMPQQMPVTLAADAPFARKRVAVGNRGQPPVEVRRDRPTALVLANRPVLPPETVEPGPFPFGKKIPDVGLQSIRLPAAVANQGLFAMLENTGAAVGTAEFRQPGVHRRRSTIKK